MLAGRTLEENLQALHGCRGRVDLAELRVDQLEPEEAAAAARFPARAGVPVILTVRRPSDGGRFAGTEAQRIALLKRLLGGGFSYVDLEEDLETPGLDAEVRSSGARVVRSFHDLTGVPPGLSRRIAALPRSANEIPKAAVTPRSCQELAEVLAACRPPVPSPRIVLGMGDVGFPTRILAGRLGCAWCYASPTDQSVAPGQVTPQALEETYRFRSVSPSTALYGVMGNPVMHSRSPSLHNRGFQETGIDAVYVPFHVPDVDGFWAVADALGLRGLSVTVPHKTAVLGPRVEPDDVVREVGACNTLVRAGGSGKWQAFNLDVEGFLAPLRTALGGTIPTGMRATVIGAGGAARAVVYALRTAGAHVLVLNRTRETARALAVSFGGEAAGLDPAGLQAAEGFSDLIVQTTSVGMTPREGEDPAPGLRFRGRELVYELVYAPPETPFVRRAVQAGCRILYGRQMLLAQASLQFTKFCGIPYPSGLLLELERKFD